MARLVVGGAATRPRLEHRAVELDRCVPYLHVKRDEAEGPSGLGTPRHIEPLDDKSHPAAEFVRRWIDDRASELAAVAPTVRPTSAQSSGQMRGREG